MPVGLNDFGFSDRLQDAAHARPTTRRSRAGQFDRFNPLGFGHQWRCEHVKRADIDWQIQNSLEFEAPPLVASLDNCRDVPGVPGGDVSTIVETFRVESGNCYHFAD